MSSEPSIVFEKIECPICANRVDATKFQKHIKKCLPPTAREDESASSDEEEEVQCPRCDKMITSDKLAKHVKKCTVVKKSSEETYIEDAFANCWISVGEKRTTVPPVEIDMSNAGTFSCQWGCLTAAKRKPKTFESKTTFLQHIATTHPDLRICIETPPNAVKPTGATQGTRFLVQEGNAMKA
jgi:hypothetical protein